VKRWTLAAAAALALAASGCGGGGATDVEPPSAHAHAPADGAHSDVATGAREVHVGTVGLRFDPEEITVSAGEDVAIVLTSGGGVHDFVVEGADVHVAAAGGQTSVGGLRIDEAGTYTFYCSVGRHRAAGMQGTLVVEAS
jgi:plastocyanin